MRYWPFFLAVLLLSACITREDSSEVALAPTWKRLNISGVGSIYAATGDFSTRFYIATAGRVFVTVDEGANWSTSLQLVTASPPLGFAKHGDSLILRTVVQDYVTEDQGVTWNMSEPSGSPVESRQLMFTSRGDRLAFKPPVKGGHHHGPDGHGEDGHSPLAPPAELYWIRAATMDTVSIFPYKAYAYSVYLDQEDRVFICTNDWEWDPDLKGFTTKGSKNDGVIYMGKL